MADWLSTLLQIGGAIVGGAFGGPQGAAAGASIGGGIGGGISGGKGGGLGFEDIAKLALQGGRLLGELFGDEGELPPLQVPQAQPTERRPLPELPLARRELPPPAIPSPPPRREVGLPVEAPAPVLRRTTAEDIRQRPSAEYVPGIGMIFTRPGGGPRVLNR